MDSVLPLGVLDTAGGKILVLNFCIKIIWKQSAELIN
jgi:hypothetical protein